MVRLRGVPINRGAGEKKVERLRWRIWNGKAKDAKRSIDRIRKVMHVYKRNQALDE